ncbi:MAG: acyloxyacyl hydrolase [Candidatus Nitrotoga sp.]|nr:acyloxyacyl hydrolase [Candidatus Nitrotoga sp.]MBP0117814.1 acyloxyacyl hydrolase [Candidatus Nitrotoga sp.]MBP0126253.1 acyloxyacyl hydrolase [Candidatus Nitrotoga sp.]
MKKIGVLLGILLLTGNACAIDGISAVRGNGSSTEMAGVQAQWDWEKKWFTEHSWLVAGFWEANVGRWDAQNGKSFKDVGFTPVFRLQQKNPSVVAPYVEAAIGVHLISPVFVNGDRQFSSVFQFGDHLGVGARFGDRQQFDIGFRFQHLSNAGFSQPNPGINYNEIRLAYHF